MEERFKELDSVFDSIIDEIENPGRSYSAADIFRNLHGEKTEYADYAKVVYTIVIRIADDNMSAAINVISTADKIRRYTMTDLNRVIRSKRIVFGIKSDALMNMVADQVFNRDIVFARGTFAENGKDGFIEPLIKIPDGKLSVPVKKGANICRVVPPTAGIHGCDIFGKVLPAKNGSPVSILIGDNTAYDKKTGMLSATAGGSLSLKNGVYSVSDELVINGNVNADNGRIEFAGNIIISGNVMDGAEIYAEKSVYIKGKIRDAVIHAGKDITADLSVKQSKLITEKGNMQLTNCFDSEITCGGNIEAASFYNCKTKSVGNINCTINQGSINGGETYSISKISCITAGSRLHEQTLISVGDCSEYTAKQIMLRRSLNRIDGEIEKITKRIDAINSQKHTLGFITREDEDFLVAAMRIREQKETEKIPILSEIEEMETIIASSSEAHIKVSRSMHANVRLRVKEYHRDIDMEFGRVTVYSNDYGIVMS